MTSHFLRRRARLSLTFAAAVPLCPTLASAQQQFTDRSGTVEVVGLRQWTTGMLVDSIARYAPGASLFQTDSCEKALTTKLAFPTAYFLKTILGGPGAEAATVLLFVVEPTDSARVRWGPAPTQRLGVPGSWRSLDRALSNGDGGRFSEGNLMTPLALYARYRHLGEPSALERASMFGLDTAGVRRVWSALSRLTRRSDRDQALSLVEHARDPHARMMAVAVLTNFPEDDHTWITLARSLRDPYTGVNHAAMFALEGLSREFARPIDWTPAVPDLSAVLDGTNIEAFLTTTQLLTRTEIAPALAVPLLRGRGPLLADVAGVRDARSRKSATEFLVRISRLGESTNWSAWLRGL